MTIFEEINIQKEEPIVLDYTLTNQSGTRIAADGNLVLRLYNDGLENKYSQNFAATETTGEYTITIANSNLTDFEVEELNWFDIVQKTSTNVITQVEPLSPFIMRY